MKGYSPRRGIRVSKNTTAAIFLFSALRIAGAQKAEVIPNEAAFQAE
jgi:hypothetical protein